MPTESKPMSEYQQFFVPLVTLVVNNNPSNPQTEVVHVIEYAALTDLQKQVAELKQQIADYEKALESAEKELFRFNCDAPLELTNTQKPEYLKVREVLYKYRGQND